MARRRSGQASASTTKRRGEAERAQRVALARVLARAHAAFQCALMHQILHAWAGEAAETSHRSLRRRLNVVSYRVSQLLARRRALSASFNAWAAALRSSEVGALVRTHLPFVRAPPGLCAQPAVVQRAGWTAYQ